MVNIHKSEAHRNVNILTQLSVTTQLPYEECKASGERRPVVVSSREMI